MIEEMLPYQLKAFRVDPELKTAVWDNGADLAH